MSFCIFNQQRHQADGTRNTATLPMLQRCAKHMKNRQSDQIDFLTKLVEQCPDNCLFELQCNWTSTRFSENELAEIINDNIKHIQSCKTDRQAEIFKSFCFENYKYKDTSFGKFSIWNEGLNLLITADNKREVREQLRKYLDNSDICHCQIYTQDRHIAECYDSFMNCRLDSRIFKFTARQKKKYADNEIYFDNET